ncbi:hypothetical protein CLONEX_02658 [[Clostridium] nexile DSM 1787]|nr:hypothetical protein CLONEX_02658 [[Clostridium] nexile DSM 1787]
MEDVLTYKNIRNIVGRQSIDCLLICIIEKIAISSGRGEENVSGSLVIGCSNDRQ